MLQLNPSMAVLELPPIENIQEPQAPIFLAENIPDIPAQSSAETSTAFLVEHEDLLPHEISIIAQFGIDKKGGFLALTLDNKIKPERFVTVTVDVSQGVQAPVWRLTLTNLEGGRDEYEVTTTHPDTSMHAKFTAAGELESQEEQSAEAPWIFIEGVLDSQFMDDNIEVMVDDREKAAAELVRLAAIYEPQPHITPQHKKIYKGAKDRAKESGFAPAHLIPYERPPVQLRFPILL